MHCYKSYMHNQMCNYTYTRQHLNIRKNTPIVIQPVISSCNNNSHFRWNKILLEYLMM